MVDLTAAEVFRDFVSDGIPSSGEHDPKKPDIRRLLGQYEQIIRAFTSNGSLIYSSLAALNADLSKPANSMAWVMGDPIAANNGVYGKVGASGAGSWARRGDLPFSFIIASDVGAGAPNAIEATTSIPVSASALIWMNVAEESTGSPVTISFNGGSPLTVKTNSGNDVAAGGLMAGMIVMGVVSGSTFRLLNDQVSSAIVAAAEAAQAAAEVAQAAAEAAAAGVSLPAVAPNSMLVDNAAGTTRESKTFDQVKSLWDPDNQLLLGEGLRLTYHKARESWNVKEFNASLTAVGTGNAAVDTAALQAAVGQNEIISMTGGQLSINAPIVVANSGVTLTAERSGRVGGDTKTRITATDDAMPTLFDVRAANFEASGFALAGNATNVTTTAMQFRRPDGSASDIDCVLKDLVIERFAKGVHIFGRGIEVGGCTFAEMKTCTADIDWPSVWTPNGQSNDTQETGMRSYHFYNTRLHGNAAGIRNIGANAQNMRGLIVNGALADIGSGASAIDQGGIFIGVLGEGSILTNLVANISASIGGQLVELRAGSRSSIVSNFTCKGIKSGVTRVLRTPIIVETSVANPTYDIAFANGALGVCNRYGVLLRGAGTAYLSFGNVMFDRTGMEGSQYSPLHILENGGTLTDVYMKLADCNFRFGGETVPSAILGGLNTAAVHLRRDYTTTKPSSIAWAGNLVDNVGPA